jgi:hypothetical protein
MNRLAVIVAMWISFVGVLRDLARYDLGERSKSSVQ